MASGFSDFDGEVTATTTLPAPSLASLEVSGDDITANYTLNDNSTDGEVAVEVSTDGGSTWTDGNTTTDLSATTLEAAGLQDETQYTVRISRRTDDATATSGTLQATTEPFTGIDVAARSVSFGWEDPDEFAQDGYYIERRQPGVTSFEQIADVGASVGAYTDSGLIPGTEYEYRLIAYQDGGSTLEVGSGTFTTLEGDRDGTRVRPTGWSVSITHPVSGRTIRPDAINPDQVQFIPGPNTMPRIRIPVRRAPSWLSQEFDDNPEMTVHLDGEQLPIDELVNVEQEEGQTILVGEGGTELRATVQAEYDAEERPTAATDLVSTNTPYAVVDNTAAADPDTLTVQSPSGESELGQFISPANDFPLEFTGGGLKPQQSSFTREAESADRETGTLSSTGTDRYSNGDAVLFDASASAEWDFTTEYPLPSGDFALPFRVDIPSDGGSPHTLTFELDIDGGGFQEIGTFNFAPINDPEWFDLSGRLVQDSGATFSDPGQIPAGSHTLRIRTPRVQTGETFTSDYDTFVGLDNSGILSGSEEVTDVGGSVQYTEGTDYNMNYSAGSIEVLSSGSMSDNTEYEIDYEYTNGSDTVAIDVLAPLADSRFSYTFDNTLSSAQGYLDGPEEYPIVEAVFDAYESAFSVVGGAASVTMTDTSSGQALALSNDRGQTYPISGDNTTSVSGSFGSPGASLNLKATLSRYSPNGAQNATPRFGYDAQRLDAYELDADVAAESLLIDQTFSNNLANILGQILGSQYGWSITNEGGTTTFTVDEPGSTVAGRDPEVSESQITKKVQTFANVTIKGSTIPVSGEQFQASTSFVSLAEDDILTSSEAVYDSGGTNYVRGVDYSMSYQTGEIRALSGGDLTVNDNYQIDYQHQISATYNVPNQTGDTLTRTIPGVVSDRQAEQIAYVLAEVDPALRSPRYEGSIVVPRLDATFDPLEGLELEDLDLPDVATPLSIRGEPQLTPLGLNLQLGSKPRLEEALSNIREQVSSIADRS